MDIDIYDFNQVSGSTHKEVGTHEIIQDAISKGLNGICVISSGNYIQALREAAEGSIIDVYNLVSHTPNSVYEIEIPSGEILKTADQRVEVLKTANIEGLIQDYTDYIPQEYFHHAKNLLKDNPDYVLCPAGSGKLWMSIVKTVEKLSLETKVIGITPQGKNGFYFNYNEDCNNWDLKSVADKLTAPYTALRDEILIKAPRHYILEVNEKQFRKAHKVARNSGLNCEMSASAGFVIYDKEFQKLIDIKPDSKVKIVSTGIGFGEQEVRVHESKTSSVRSSIVPVALFSSLLLGAGVYFCLKDSLEHHADLNGDGFVSSLEVLDSNIISGNLKITDGDERYQRYVETPIINLSSLVEIKKIEERIKEQAKNYGDYDNSRLSLIVNRNINSINDLNFRELTYLNSYITCVEESIDCNFLWIYNQTGSDFFNSEM
ncbi:pyridoxal-phosphate dependent enzyme [archaeon]|jgi:hypothetical protein|nr:pyridoxal-phosphate dependent enzyme [archaeon]MBT3450818.1 pyridoxal-phosphate dependent enzyme [archaeon]MBT6868473.1 pyridoxal-phosphate dependent enzyme [archaeon]MBT7193572.1 pyridoxal-phosphate dependent enzyme [archaeon]MBT7381233.1 pyridoxal-phosphate dependent enzyme [archaeon]